MFDEVGQKSKFEIWKIRQTQRQTENQMALQMSDIEYENISTEIRNQPSKQWVQNLP